jgi:hypothetical protein
VDGVALFGTIPIDESDEHNFNLFFEARNGKWVELYRSKRIDGQWLVAIKVLKRGTTHVLYEYVDPLFPVNWN